MVLVFVPNFFDNALVYHVMCGGVSAQPHSNSLQSSSLHGVVTHTHFFRSMHFILCHVSVLSLTANCCIIHLLMVTSRRPLPLLLHTHIAQTGSRHSFAVSRDANSAGEVSTQQVQGCCCTPTSPRSDLGILSLCAGYTVFFCRNRWCAGFTRFAAKGIAGISFKMLARHKTVNCSPTRLRAGLSPISR